MISKMNLLVVLSVVVAMVSAFTLPQGSVSRSASRTAVFGVSRENIAMAATLQKESVRTAGPAVQEKPEVQEKKKSGPNKERSHLGNEVWEVRIYNDGMNTREHVARSLVQVTGLSELGAYQTMMQAHQNGIAVVGRWCFEVAEMYNEGLRKNGIISDIVPVDEKH